MLPSSERNILRMKKKFGITDTMHSNRLPDEHEITDWSDMSARVVERQPSGNLYCRPGYSHSDIVDVQEMNDRFYEQFSHVMCQGTDSQCSWRT